MIRLTSKVQPMRRRNNNQLQYLWSMRLFLPKRRRSI
jgi:hypothetical protein